jgi:hypothetical protein
MAMCFIRLIEWLYGYSIAELKIHQSLLNTHLLKPTEDIVILCT